MKLFVAKIFCTVFIAFLIGALGSTARMQKQEDCIHIGGGDKPPWFDNLKKCNNRQRTFIWAGGYGTADRRKTLCFLYIHICSLVMKRDTEEAYGTKCPVVEDFAQPTFCCEQFNKAVKSKQPCDPMQDADCDGIPNDKDDDPFEPDKKKYVVTEQEVARAITKAVYEHGITTPAHGNPDNPYPMGLYEGPNRRWEFGLLVSHPDAPELGPLLVNGVVTVQSPCETIKVDLSVLERKKLANGLYDLHDIPGAGGSGQGDFSHKGLDDAMKAAFDKANVNKYVPATPPS